MRLSLPSALALLLISGCATSQPGLDTPDAGAQPTSGGVQIAQWTPPDVPDDAIVEATLWSGDLIVDDGCVSLTDPAGNLLLVFPFGTAEWNDATSSLTYEGETYQVGDDLFLSGGWATRGSSKLGGGEQSIPSCDVERLFLIDWVKQ